MGGTKENTKANVLTLRELRDRLDSLLEGTEHDGKEPVFVSLDVSTGEEDADHRLFGDSLVVIDHGATIGISAILAEDNYDYKQEGAKDDHRAKG